MGIASKVLLFILICPFARSTSAEDICKKTGPCVCEFSNGTGINLTPSTSIDFYKAQYVIDGDKYANWTLSTFYFHPCVDVRLNINTTSSKDTCIIPSAICRQVNTLSYDHVSKAYTLSVGDYDYLGDEIQSTFSSDGTNLIYTNGPSKTTVHLVCAEGENKLIVESLEEPDNEVLAFYTPDACLKTIELPSRSSGSTLLIIFFSFVIFYLVLGICTKKFLMGATGVEVIPNLSFWSDLPKLIKDGWAYAANGFKLPARGPGPTTAADPNSYDSI